MANEEIGNLVVKVGIDGSGFQNGVSNINRQLKIVETEFKAASTSLGDFGKSTEGLQLKADSLTKQLELQKQRVDVLQQAYNKSATAKGTDAKATQDLTIKLNNAKTQMSAVENELQKTNSKIEEQTSFWGKLKQSVNGATTSAKNDVFSLGNVVKSSLVFGAIYSGLNAVKDGFKAAVGGGIEFNANLQDNETAFTQMLGSADAAKKMLDELMQFAATTPFELPQVEDAAKKLLAFGFTAEQIMPMLKSIGDAAAGLGLGAEGVNRITLALGQMQAKGKVQGDEMLQLVEAGIPAYDILAKSIGVTTAQLQDMISKGQVPAAQAIDVLVKGMEERFPNMMEKQSKGFRGLMNNLKDNLNQAYGEVMKPVFEWLTNIALPRAVAATTKFIETIKSAGTIEAFKTIIPPNVVDGFITFGATVKDIFNFIREHGEGVTKTIVAIGTGFLVFKTITGIIEAIRIGMIALTLVMEINPFFLAATAAVAAVVLIYENWRPISGFFKDLFSGIGGSFSNAWNSIKEATISVFTSIADFFKQWGTVLLAMFMPMIGIPVLIIQHWAAIKEFFIKDVPFAIGYAAGFMVKTFSEAVDGTINFFKELPTNLKNHLTTAFNNLRQWAIDTKNLAVQTGKDFLDGVVDFFYQLPGRIVSFAKDVYDSAKNIGENIFNGIVEFVQSIPERIRQFFSNMISEMFSFVGKIKDVFSSIGSNTSKGFQSGVSTNVSAFANGTNYAPGGWAIYGENGPELGYVPRGTQIKTADETKQLLNPEMPQYVQTTVVIDGRTIANVLSKAQYNNTLQRSRGTGVNMR